MSGYKRLISYVYQYEDGVKKNNVGFARIEIKNGTCKITIRIRVYGKMDRIKAYLFFRASDRMNHILLQDIKVHDSLAECKIETSENNMMNTYQSFDEMGGIILYYDEQRYYATEWDNKPIEFKGINEWTRSSKAEGVVLLEEERKPAGNTDSKPEVITEETPEIIPEIVPDVEPMMEEMKQDREMQEEEIIVRKVDVKSEDHDLEMQEANIEQKKEPTLTEKILNIFPSMYPFEDDEVEACVKIDPQDIGMLPMEAWILGKNSFLLNGYFAYRHLIFAKTKKEENDVFYLGVPGVFHNRDQFMAKMFGFTNFKSVKRNSNIQGEFGYWMKEIDCSNHV